MKLKIGFIIGLLLLFFPVKAYDFEVDGIYYEVISLTDLTCQVVLGDEPYKGDIVIPSEVDYNTRKIKVVSIANNAFYFNDDLTSVIINASITDLSELQFLFCRKLSSVILPETLQVIENSTFAHCWSLSSIELPNFLTKIGKEAFLDCNTLTYIDIPDSVTEIGELAFSDCSSLSSINLPNSVSQIGSNAFFRCTALTSLDIPDSVAEISKGLFSYCTQLNTIVLPNSVTSIKAGAFLNCSSLTTVVIPNSVIEIESSAFEGCNSLEEITLSDTLQSIQSSTFRDCGSLRSITIPGSVNSINLYNRSIYGWFVEFPFQNCNHLNEIRFEHGEDRLSGFAAYYYYSGVEQKEVELIFYCTTDDESPENPNELKIEKVFIDREFSQILHVPYLKELTLGEHIGTVEVILPETLESITSYALVPPLCPSFSTSQFINMKVRVPLESLKDYQNAEGWKNFWNLEGFDASDVNEVMSNEVPYEMGRYNINGTPVDKYYDGLIIIVYSDGSVRKMMSKN